MDWAAGRGRHPVLRVARADVHDSPRDQEHVRERWTPESRVGDVGTLVSPAAHRQHRVVCQGPTDTQRVLDLQGGPNRLTWTVSRTVLPRSFGGHDRGPLLSRRGCPNSSANDLLGRVRYRTSSSRRSRVLDRRVPYWTLRTGTICRSDRCGAPLGWRSVRALGGVW